VSFGRLRGAGRWALLAALAPGLIGLAPAGAEAKRIKIRIRSDPGGAWPIGRAAVAPSRGEEAAAAAVATPGRAEAAQARARAALAAERAAERAGADAAAARAGEAGLLGGTAGPEAAVVCIAGC
jgi:hypothetical protein